MDGATSRSRGGPSPPAAVSHAEPRTAGAGRVPDPALALLRALAASRLAKSWPRSLAFHSVTSVKTIRKPPAFFHMMIDGLESATHPHVCNSLIN